MHSVIAGTSRLDSFTHTLIVKCTSPDYLNRLLETLIHAVQVNKHRDHDDGVIMARRFLRSVIRIFIVLTAQSTPDKLAAKLSLYNQSALAKCRRTFTVSLNLTICSDFIFSRNDKIPLVFVLHKEINLIAILFYKSISSSFRLSLRFLLKSYVRLQRPWSPPFEWGSPNPPVLTLSSPMLQILSWEVLLPFQSYRFLPSTFDYQNIYCFMMTQSCLNLSLFWWPNLA